MLKLVKEYRPLRLQEKHQLRKTVSEKKSHYVMNYIQARATGETKRANQARYNHFR